MIALIRKLEHFAPLSERDEAALRGVLAAVGDYSADVDILREGERPNAVFAIASGFACRYKRLENGRRQIVNFLVPGDAFDLQSVMLEKMDHSVATLSAARIARIPTTEIVALYRRHPRIGAALLWSVMQEEAILRERVTSLGRRSAEDRLAFLVCEMLWRLNAVGAAERGRFELPLTQAEMADCLGLSTVHVNRVLQQLRARGLLTFRGGAVRILDVEGLTALAGFDDTYLHLGGAPTDFRAYIDGFDLRAPG